MRAKLLLVVLLGAFPLSNFAQEMPAVEQTAPPVLRKKRRVAKKKPAVEVPKWHFEVQPGYYLFTDADMRQFYDNGGFTIRGEFGYKFWGPLMVWIDGSYFQKDGHALGGTEKLKFMLATITLGLKAHWYLHPRVAFYVGAAPRLFMLKNHNDSPFVRSVDNEIGVGGGFDAGFWFFPIPQWDNLFLDLFADYSWKKMQIEEDEISSLDNDINCSGTTFGLGLGIRF
jgi:hypothetical protein